MITVCGIVNNCSQVFLLDRLYEHHYLAVLSYITFEWANNKIEGRKEYLFCCLAPVKPELQLPENICPHKLWHRSPSNVISYSTRCQLEHPTSLYPTAADETVDKLVYKGFTVY